MVESGSRRHAQRQGATAAHRSPLRGRIPYTDLRHNRKEILASILHESYLIWPEQARDTEYTRSSNEYCHFHRQTGHNTNDCTTLRNEIERLISLGYLLDCVVRQENYLPPKPTNEPKATVEQTRNKSAATTKKLWVPT